MSADDPNLIPVVTNATASPAQPAIVDYLAPEPHNRYAARALVCGLLGFIPFVPGILAIRYGRRGLRAFDADPRIGGKGTAKAGLWLGVASIIAWTALAVGGVPALVVARRQAIRVHCASNLRQVAMAITMYAAGNRGFIPPDLDALVKSKIVPAALFQCPAAVGDPTKPAASFGAFGAYGYVYLGAGQHMNALRSPQNVPLVYEPPTNHHDGGINVAFADGHVEFMPAPAVPAFLARYGGAATQPSGALVPSTAPVEVE